MTTKKETNKPTLDEYLKEGKITKNLYDTISVIQNEDKKKRVVETLHRRIDKRKILMGFSESLP